MIKFFNEEMLVDISKKRKKMLIIIFSIIGVYLVFSGVMLAWYMTMPYQSPKINVFKAIEYSVTAVIVLFLFIYIGIPFGKVNRFYAMCVNMVNGIKEPSEGFFFEYSETITTKDGVDMKALVFLQWNKYKKNYFERDVLVFNGLEFPTFTENQKVRYVTVSNVLYSYEILEDGEEDLLMENGDEQ